MNKTHVVEQGECMITIAEKYYYVSWKDIYYSDLNKALREKRSDPTCLYPGDVVNLPKKKTKKVDISMNQSHKFVLKRQKSYFTFEYKR